MKPEVGVTAHGDHRGPSLVAVAIVYLLLFVGAIVSMIVLAGGPFPSPFRPEDAIPYFTEHRTAVRVASFFNFGSAVPFAVFAAATVSRLRFLGVTVAGAHIALFGGAVASVMLAVSALAAWVLGTPGVDEIRALQLVSFAAGGVGYAVFFGLFVAGVSVSAGLARLIPRWVMWSGLGLAALGELSSLTLLFDEAAYLLPATRFLGYAWLICLGAVLPKTRAA